MTNEAPFRIRYMSDVHLEFAGFTPAPAAADVIVLAGDIGTGTEGLEWAITTFPDIPIVYVPGNHEYYEHDLPDLRVELATRASQLGIHLLDHDVVVIGRVRFLGATLWTDFELQGSRASAMRTASRRMNDYRLIHHGVRLLRPSDTRLLHQASRRFLTQQLDIPFDGKTVVVTHHAPSLRSLPVDKLESGSAPCYASDLEQLVERADCWIHGHTHQRQDYQVGGCRVLCNPRGYQAELYRQQTGFDERAVVTL